MCVCECGAVGASLFFVLLCRGVSGVWAKEGIVLSFCLPLQWQGRQVSTVAALSHCPA